MKKNLNPIPVTHRTVPEPKGQHLDFVNIAYSHLVHSYWDKLNSLITHLTPFRVKHVLMKLQKDYVISLEFFNWVQTHKPNSHTLETHLMILRILTKSKKFKSAESILKGLWPWQVAEAMAVLRGIRFAVDAGLVPAVIESDAKYVVDLIKLAVAPSADVPELSC
ncbi:hypothetical protein LWI29_031523 [Acer saccharum]|uniref:RNase H type-1 domain-containing protein n=1 Tax=Acer saccharum TaxID=4024 RepID=A0AA39SJF7_ACESA|nr:hypothetical protein LWI29_031523 [Acer saccharum]